MFLWGTVTPFSPTIKPSKSDGKPFSDPTAYRQVVGTLQYLTLTRPDISFAVNKVCQFMQNPSDEHWILVKRILRYLSQSLNLGLLISRSTHLKLQAFSDSNWAGCPDDRRSTGGYAIYKGNNLVSWSSRKQRTIARSSTESEYKAVTDATAKLSWIQSLLFELGLYLTSPPVLWCDNIGATYLTSNPILHARTKHVEIDYHFVCEKVARGDLLVHYLSTKDQIADLFTKGLPTSRFCELSSKLKLRSRPPSACGGC